jgi:putative transposase
VLTDDQEATLASWLGSLRQLYNLAIEHRSLNYQQFKKCLNYYDQASELCALKETAPWIAEVPHHCLQQKLKDVESAFQRFFKSNFGYPKFKKRGHSDSMRFPDVKQFRVDFRQGKRTSFVKLPKIGLLKFVSSQKIVGKFKNCTISKDSSGFYISFQSEYEIDVAPNLGPAIGIDRGVRTLATTSSGECLELPTAIILKFEKKTARAQQRLTKK